MASREENIWMFQQASRLFAQDMQLRACTERAVVATCVHGPGFHSTAGPSTDASATMEVHARTTTEAAYDLVQRDIGRVALLNFAKPVNIGGGVTRGARAQEEDLCRWSNLYACLQSEAALPYYQRHREIAQRNGDRPALSLATDALAYSEGVTFLVGANAHSQVEERAGTMRYLGETFEADVITCAAPAFWDASKRLPDGDLQELFERRVRNILEAAIEHRATVLVLGAFGCGAFRNPPTVVAAAFRTVLSESRYARAFAHIEFAIKPTGPNCLNVAAFKKLNA